MSIIDTKVENCCWIIFIFLMIESNLDHVQFTEKLRDKFYNTQTVSQDGHPPTIQHPYVLNFIFSNFFLCFVNQLLTGRPWNRGTSRDHDVWVSLPLCVINSQEDEEGKGEDEDQGKNSNMTWGPTLTHLWCFP